MTTNPLMNFSEEALERIIEIRDQEPGEEEYGLLIEITGVQGLQFGYSLSFIPLNEAEPSDHVEHHGELAVIIPEAGGVFTDFSGCPSFRSGTGLATNGALHDPILALVRG